MKRKTNGKADTHQATTGVSGSKDEAATQPSTNGRQSNASDPADGVRVEAGTDVGREAAGGFLGKLKTFESLRSPVFRLFFGSMLGQMGAMNMEMIARSLLVYRITGSATILGVMALANSVPMLFLSLYGGVLADRVPKKRLLVIGQSGSALVSLVVAAALTSGWLGPEHPSSWWILVAVSLVKGAVQGFMMPARSAIIPEIVKHTQILNAVALNNFGMNILRLMAPALAGFFIDLWSFQAIYYFMVGLYIVATLFVLKMPLTGTVSVGRHNALTKMKEGFIYIRQDANIIIVLVFTLFAVLCSMPYMMLLPVFTEDILHVGAKGMGILVSVSGIGAMAGSLFLASIPNRKRGALLLLSSLIMGVALVGFSFSTSWSLSLAMIIFVGLGQTGRMTLANALLQSYTQKEYLGRVMSVYMMEFGITSFSVFFAGLLTEGVGIQWSVGGLAIAMVIFVVLMFLLSPRMRKLD